MNYIEILVICYLVAGVIQLFFYLFAFLRFAFSKPATLKSNEEPVSVIIAARNEQANLLENLPAVLSQTYLDYEVIVVDDCSWDGTEEVLRAFDSQYGNFRYITVKETDKFFGGKKFALTLGIKAANNELLIFIDADCRPKSDQWLACMAGGFKPGKELVLGYGAYAKSGGLLNSLIRFDAFWIALQYLSFAKAFRPYMGVGRNLAYRKEFFFRNKGFASHLHIPSGDDDLFVNQAATRSNTSIVFEHDSHTTSPAKSTFPQWLAQKRRHLTTGSEYRFTDKCLLGLLALSQWLFFGLFITLLVLNYHVYLVAGVFGFRFLIQMIVIIPSMKKLGESDLIIFAPLLEIVLMLFYPIFALANLFVKRTQWKR